MTTAILADENVDHRVVHLLDHYGHDVQHVDFTPKLDKGADDERIADYSSQTGRPILTSDDDFLAEFGRDEYAGVLFLEDETLDPATTADIVNVILDSVESLDGRVFYVSRNWL